MTERALESIEIEGFLSIRSTSVRLGRINVLVGANGAGKSNFVKAFDLIGRIANGEMARFVGFNGGASALLNSLPDVHGINLELRWQDHLYRAELAPAADDELIFFGEFATYGDEGGDPPYFFSGGHRETKMNSSTGVRQPGTRVLALLADCRVYHFHDTSFDAPVKQTAPTADNIALRGDAGNLAAVLLALNGHSDPVYQAAYRRILGAVRLVAPFFRDFVLRPESNDRIRLRWRQVDSDVIFSANQMSDGTLRFICLATLLMHPSLPAQVVLDGPELGLHPFAIVQLAGMIRQASTRSQVVLATQSVTLMNQFELDDLIVVERENAVSIFKRPDRDKLAEWLAYYSVGELWEKNLIGGRPTRED